MDYLKQDKKVAEESNPFYKNCYLMPQPLRANKNRCVKLKRSFHRQTPNGSYSTNSNINTPSHSNALNNYLSTPLAVSKQSIQPKQRSESQQFINHFIRCEKQRLAYKLEQPPTETIQQVLFHIRSNSTGFRKNDDLSHSSFHERKRYNTRNTSQKTDQSGCLKKISKDKKQEVLDIKIDIQTAVSKVRQSKMRSLVTPELGRIRKGKAAVSQIHVRNHIKKPNLEFKEKKRTIEQEIKLNKPIVHYDFEELSHIRSESYCILEYPNNQLMLTFRAKILLEIASLTKIMTCFLVLSLAQLHKVDIAAEKVQIQEFIEDTTGTSAELNHGDILSIQQLLYGLMLPSGNDASLALAAWGGKYFTTNTDTRQRIKAFVSGMNQKAKQIGLKDTRYGNTHGLPHYESRSTALDLCKLISKCMNNSIFNKITNTKKYRTVIGTSYRRQREVFWENTNKLLRREGFFGVKTGITVTAGPCLASAYKFRDRIFIIVVLRANKISRRFTETRKILYWFLRKIYKGNVTLQEHRILQELNRNNRELDSDNSEDEAEFIYNNQGYREFAKRKKIIKQL